MRALSVSQLNEYVRGVLANDALLSRVTLRGEISGFKRHTSGHLYFILKDEEASIRCVMFRQNAQSVAFSPRDGMLVQLTGEVSIYVRDGQYQFYARQMATDGVGALYKAFLELKEKLEKEGLFDASRKLALPKYPRTLGVVTSCTGAVFHDIVNVATRRDPRIDIVLCPVKVQGGGAAEDIAAGIARMNELGRCDVLIVGRGGGSAEDLFCFNEEVVARAIAASRIPIISAVGHETDFTIADFAADVRAPTPSAAAEICVPLLSDMTLHADMLVSGLRDAMNARVSRERERLTALHERLGRAHPGVRVKRANETVANARKFLDTFMRARVERARMKLDSLSERLEALAPTRVLSRGYAVVELDGRVISSVEMADIGKEMRVRVSDGAIMGQIREIERTAGER